MAPYKQSCQCRGRTLSAVKDIKRYEQEAHDIGLDIARLERERDEVRQKAKRARIKLLDEPTGTCSVCQGSGVVESKGAVGQGSTGGFRASDWMTANRVG